LSNIIADFQTLVHVSHHKAFMGFVLLMQCVMYRCISSHWTFI